MPKNTLLNMIFMLMCCISIHMTIGRIFPKKSHDFKIKNSSTIFISLRMLNETSENNGTNETKEANSASSDNQTEESSSGELTSEEVENIIRTQNQILKKEMEQNKASIHQELNKSNQEFSGKLEETTTEIKIMIRSSHDKIKKSLKKLDFQIKETAKQNDDVASIIISKEIKEKQEELDLLSSEIEKTLQDPVINERNETDNQSACGSYLSCRECANNSNCGWCETHQTCVEGDSYGPLYGICSFYSFSKCNDNDCESYSNCEQCLSNPLCGWCKDLMNNIEGCLNHDFDIPVCPKAGWFQIGTEQNLCELTGKLKKSDFRNGNMSAQQKRLVITQKRQILKEKQQKMEDTKKQLVNLKEKLEELKNHYKNQEYEEFEENDDLEFDPEEEKNLRSKICPNITKMANNTNNSFVDDQNENNNMINSDNESDNDSNSEINDVSEEITLESLNENFSE